MRPKRKMEQALRRKLRFAAGARLHDRLWSEVLRAREESSGTEPARRRPTIRRIVTKSVAATAACVAAGLAVALLLVALWMRPAARAYALDQTVEALQSVQFVHVIQHDDTGRIRSERWIEIGTDGAQVRYRQEKPPQPVGVIEDGESIAVYRHDKKAVILLPDRPEHQYVWASLLGQALENVRQKGKVLEENIEYQGRRAHRVWWPAIYGECYVDAETKLPLATADSELRYEEPPAGAFEIVIPEGYTVVDTRPGAAGPLPEWFVEEETLKENAGDNFLQGMRALVRGDSAEAAAEFEMVVKVGYDTWAWFWLGSAYYNLGRYDLAIEKFTQMLEKLKDTFQSRMSLSQLACCYYARGLAYARLGRQEEAEADWQLCLPAMVRVLRIPSAGFLFEYADNPLVRLGEYRPTDQEIVTKMVNRLRLITGQDFGYDPNGTPEQNEAARAAWEQWLKNDGQIRFTPDAKLIPVPAARNP